VQTESNELYYKFCKESRFQSSHTLVKRHSMLPLFSESLDCDKSHNSSGSRMNKNRMDVVFGDRVADSRSPTKTLYTKEYMD
jgi:hypothetical protein